MIELQPNTGVEIWGGVTDPTEHNPENFRYLLLRDTGTHEWIPNRSGIGQKAESSSFLIEDPARIVEIPGVWGSVIDQDHMSIPPQGRHLLIAEVDADGVVMTEPHDHYL